MKALKIIIGGAIAVVIVAAIAGGSNDKDASATRTETVFIGHQARVKTGFIGCIKTDDTERVKELVRQHDSDAASAISHGCRAIDAGKIGVIEDLSVWTGNSCIRTRGEPNCYWFPTVLIEPANG